MKTSLNAPGCPIKSFSWGDVLDFQSQLLEASTPFVMDCSTMNIAPTVEDYESWKQVQEDLAKESLKEEEYVR